MFRFRASAGPDSEDGFGGAGRPRVWAVFLSEPWDVESDSSPNSRMAASKAFLANFPFVYG